MRRCYPINKLIASNIFLDTLFALAVYMSGSLLMCFKLLIFFSLGLLHLVSLYLLITIINFSHVLGPDPYALAFSLYLVPPL